ncbi:hypothetical protein BDQ17DRAFT_415050 [Cyathus striatus]|nr:hypothetical protein BDQ17DRAFT_415050 [Cyathus striatus]
MNGVRFGVIPVVEGIECFCSSTSRAVAYDAPPTLKTLSAARCTSVGRRTVPTAHTEAQTNRRRMSRFRTVGLVEFKRRGLFLLSLQGFLGHLGHLSTPPFSPSALISYDLVITSILQILLLESQQNDPTLPSLTIFGQTSGEVEFWLILQLRHPSARVP